MTDESKRYDLATLSKKSGVSPRRIRFWTQKRLVPPPMGKGRKARYDETHLARLRVISSLRDSNLPLGVIHDYLEKYDVAESDAESPAESPVELTPPVALAEEEAGSESHRASATHVLTAPLRGLAGAGLSGAGLTAAALDYAAKARAAAATVARAPSDLIGSRLAVLGHGPRRPPQEGPAPSFWERIPITPDLEIHVRASRLSSQVNSPEERRADAEETEQQTLLRALKVLEENPDGLQIADLFRSVEEADSSLNPETLPYLLWRLVEEHPEAVYSPSDGLLRLVRSDDDGPPVGTREPTASDVSLVEGRYRGTATYVRILSKLVQKAEERATLRYSDLAELMGIKPRGTYMGVQVGQALDEICEDEVRLGRPMLSAVVVGYRGGPGPGFYQLARALGRLSAEDDERGFWEAELEAVYNVWQRPIPKP